MRKKAVITLIVVGWLTSSFLVAENPRGPLCDPFRPSVKNHIWFWWPEGIAGFEFDDEGNLLYIVDGVPSQYGELISSSVQKEFQKLPFTGEFTYWHPIKEGGLGGFWLKHFAVRELKQSWGTVSPGVDYQYELEEGRQLKEATRQDFKGFKSQPFESPFANYVWNLDDNELYGIEFDSNGYVRYLVHGVSGEYVLDDVPSAEYTVWYPVNPRSEQGYWIKHTAVKEFSMLWGEVSYGVDLNYMSRYTLRAMNKKDVTAYTDQPFRSPLENHVWNLKSDGSLRGFQFDEHGKLLYIVDGVPGAFSLDEVPYCGEYTVWYPLSSGSQQGYWLKYSAVKRIEFADRVVEPGIDYLYQLPSHGKSIADLSQSSQFTFTIEVASSATENCIWKKEGDELFGAQFSSTGQLLYLIHGVPGTYSLNHVPLCGEYVVWYPVEEGEDEGFWLQYVAVSEFEKEWGEVTFGIDLNCYQIEGHGISYLTRDHYNESWDIRKFIKYLWDLFNSD